MLARILELPVFLIFVMLACGAMFVPAAHALTQDAFHVARSFFYSGLLGLIICALIGVALAGRPTHHSALVHLLALLAVFVILPVILAIPVYESLRNTSFVNAYFEMVSSLTTTGFADVDCSSCDPRSTKPWRF